MRRVDGLNVSLVVVAVLATAAAWLAGPHLQEWFGRYFGPAPPALCIAALGVIALLVAPLLKGAWWGSPRIQAVLEGSLFVAGFAGFIIGVDQWVGFPADINAPLPWALLYYPAMGFAAQVALHLVPLAALVRLAPALARTHPLMIMGLASAPEAALQALSGEGVAAGLVALHLLAFGVAELHMLRRYGFAAMYSFRMAYYLVWHILWAAVRSG